MVEKSLGLSLTDKRILDYHHKWLNDRLINAAQKMLQKQYGIAGLQDVTMLQTLSMDVQVNLSKFWMWATLNGSPYLQLDVKQAQSTCMTVGKNTSCTETRASRITTFHRAEHNWDQIHECANPVWQFRLWIICIAFAPHCVRALTQLPAFTINPTCGAASWHASTMAKWGHSQLQESVNPLQIQQKLMR